MYCSPVWRPFHEKHIALLESVRKRFMKRAFGRCGRLVEVPAISTLFDDHDWKIFCLLPDEELLDHFINCRDNFFGSGISYPPRATARSDAINAQFSCRLCRRLNISQSYFTQILYFPSLYHIL